MTLNASAFSIGFLLTKCAFAGAYSRIKNGLNNQKNDSLRGRFIAGMSGTDNGVTVKVLSGGRGGGVIRVCACWVEKVSLPC